MLLLVVQIFIRARSVWLLVVGKLLVASLRMSNAVSVRSSGKRDLWYFVRRRICMHQAITG
jgi:hypothetical protein